MEEPLCTYDKYPMYKILCEEMPNTKAPLDNLVRSLQELMIQYEPVFRDTWKFILRFLALIAKSNSKLAARNISTIFSDILFKPTEYRANDMVIWRLFTDLLTFMITENERIFEGIDLRVQQ